MLILLHKQFCVICVICNLGLISVILSIKYQEFHFSKWGLKQIIFFGLFGQYVGHIEKVSDHKKKVVSQQLDREGLFQEKKSIKVFYTKNTKKNKQDTTHNNTFETSSIIILNCGFCGTCCDVCLFEKKTSQHKVIHNTNNLPFLVKEVAITFVLKCLKLLVM